MVIVIQFLSLIAMLGSLAVLIWRILTNSGLVLKHSVPELQRVGTGHNASAKECAEIFGYSMLFRLFLIGASFVIYCLFKEKATSPQWSNMVDNWIQWDATNYIRISEGYRSFNVNGDYSTIVFFPLYSWLLAIVRIFIPSKAVAGLTLSALLSSAACVYMYKLVCIDYKRTTAQMAVILMCLFPFGFFYSTIMSESAFLLTSIATLYYTRKHNWIAAGLAGLFASLSRSAGVFLIFPAAAELVESHKLFGNIRNKDVWTATVKDGLWLLLLPLGIVIYLLINYNLSGNPFYFLEMEEKYWQQVSQPFFKTAGTFFDIIANSGKSLDVLMAAFLPGFVALICAYATLVRGVARHKTMYMLWLAIYIIINTTMSWPLSFCRYIACGVPLYIVLADECDKSKKFSMALLISWSILFGIYFTGYLLVKQIM